MKTNWAQLVVLLVSGFVLSTSGFSLSFNDPFGSDYDLGSSSDSNAFNFDDFGGHANFDNFGSQDNALSDFGVSEPDTAIKNYAYAEVPEAFDDDDGYEEYIPEDELLEQPSVPSLRDTELVYPREHWGGEHLLGNSHPDDYEGFEKIHPLDEHDRAYGARDQHDQHARNHMRDHGHGHVELDNNILARGEDFAHRLQFHRLPHGKRQFHQSDSGSRKQGGHHHSRFHDSYKTDKYGNKRVVHADRHDEGGLVDHGEKLEKKRFKIHRDIEAPYGELRKHVFARKFDGKEHRREQLKTKNENGNHQLQKHEHGQWKNLPEMSKEKQMKHHY